MKNIKGLIMVIFFLLCPTIVLANSDYEINNYEYKVELDNGKYRYTENVDVTFANADTSIKKELPYTIKNLDVNTTFYLENNYNKIVEIKSGLNAKKEFEITYSDKADYSSKNDKYIVELSNTYNNTLNNIKFTIKLNNSFNKHNVSFYLNNEKIKEINYTINTDELIIEYPKLEEKDVLKVEIDYGRLYLSGLTITTILISIALSIVCYLLWYFYGKDLRLPIKKTHKFSSKLTPIDISLIYKGSVTEDDAIYLLLSLANKGYITIIENSNNNFTIKRNKEYDGKNYEEISFLKALFKKSEYVTFTEYINILSEHKKNSSPKDLEKEINNDLYRKFHRASKYVLSIINTNEEKNKYFEIKPDKIKYLLILAIAIILVLVTSLPFLESNKLFLLPLAVLFSITTLFVLISLIKNIDIDKKKNKVITLSVLSAIVLLIILLPIFRRNRIYLISYIICCISVVFILFLYKYMPKRTLYGTKQYVNIEGFKLFINELKKQELDAILEINPNYLYDILPFSYMLGVQENILKKLKEYNVEKPSWYILKDDFSYQKLHNSILRLIKYLEYKED